MKNYVSILFLFLFTYSYSQTQLGSDISVENSGDWFGKTVSISDDGSTLAVGAGFNDGNGSNSGHVKIYSGVYYWRVKTTDGTNVSYSIVYSFRVE